jgi:hypothetical protein
MFAQLGSYFLGHLATFIYLTQAVQKSDQFAVSEWPQMSLYNFLVAKFWPVYWIAYVLDEMQLQATYWRIYGVAQEEVAKLLALINLFLG